MEIVLTERANIDLLFFKKTNNQNNKQQEKVTQHMKLHACGQLCKNAFFDKALHLQATNLQVQARFKTTFQSETS